MDKDQTIHVEQTWRGKFQAYRECDCDALGRVSIYGEGITALAAIIDLAREIEMVEA